MGLLAYGDTGWGDELFFATLMTIAVAAAAIFIGFFLAAIFASFKLSKIKVLNLIGSFYTTVFRGVPELLVIYLFFLEEVVLLCLWPKYLVTMDILK